MWIQSIGLVQVLEGDKTIYTSEKAKICTFYYSGTMILIKKWKINICFFSLFLPESEENERAQRIRNRQFLLSGLTDYKQLRLCIMLSSSPDISSADSFQRGNIFILGTSVKCLGKCKQQDNFLLMALTADYFLRSVELHSYRRK